ncbi:MAG: sensor histidine kinase [Verrucomicrobia bacterium]|nr:sensor histidine kinase [Verrucomicrobiota bacterium]
MMNTASRRPRAAVRQLVRALPWIRLALLLTGVLCAPTAGAKILWQQPQPIHVRANAVEVAHDVVPRDDSSSGTLYFKFRVDPQSDTMSKLQARVNYQAGLVFRAGDRDHLGVGSATDAWGYSAFAPVFRFPANRPGELTLRTDKTEVGAQTPYQAPRRGILRTMLIKVDYVPHGDDLVTVWLEPQLSAGATEGNQPDQIETRFKVDASFDQIRLVHSGVGSGWIFDELAIATEFEDFVPVSWWRNGWLLALLALGAAAILAATVAGLERRRARRQLAVVEREQAVAAERMRIAQDLHDDLGAKVTEIVLLGELAKGETGKNSLLEIIDGLRRLHASLDEAVWSINPRNDSLADLLEFVSDSAQRFTQHAAVDFHLEVPGELPEAALSAGRRHNLVLAIKEALNNAVRHASATTIHLGFRYEAPDLRVTIADDGCGFAGEIPPGSCDGLRNMKTRLESIGGSADIRSTPGAGTVVDFRLPLPAGHG